MPYLVALLAVLAASALAASRKLGHILQPLAVGALLGGRISVPSSLLCALLLVELEAEESAKGKDAEEEESSEEGA